MAIRDLMYIDENGLTLPDYQTILADFQTGWQNIFGSDVLIAETDIDGQLLALFAQAVNDCGELTSAAYNSFQPSYAIGDALSKLVRINGLVRSSSTSSTATVRITGTPNTVIAAGIVLDDNGNQWALPLNTVIPDPAAQIDVTATAVIPGPTAATAGTISTIFNPQLGWSSAVSITDAVVGDGVETDAELRLRQGESTALPSITVVEGLQGALLSLDGVSQVRVYENPTGAPDANGIPAHSIEAVVLGGTGQDIVDTIGDRKTPGTGTAGGSSGTYTDQYGQTLTINYEVPDQITIDVEITVVQGVGYDASTTLSIQESVADFINSLEIGEDVVTNRLFTPALQQGTSQGERYEVTQILTSINPNPPDASDITIDFDEVAITVAIVNITVVT